MWLATGEVHRDEAHPLAPILDELELKVPLADRYEWLAAPRGELDNRSAFELIEADELTPLAELLTSTPLAR